MNHFGKAVGWEGYVVRINLNDDDPLSLQYHTANILVKMEIPDMPEGNGADIGLSMSEANVEKYADEIDNLQIGDKIAFNATLISLGDRNHLHHLRAFNIKKTEGHMDLHGHAHIQGRYKVKQNNNETILS